MLVSMLAAMATGSVVAAMLLDKIILESTVILLTDVLLDPLIAIVLARGAGIRGKLNGMLVAAAGGAGTGSIWVA